VGLEHAETRPTLLTLMAILRLWVNVPTPPKDLKLREVTIKSDGRKVAVGQIGIR